ncbi:MAG: GAF domain-containing protein [Thermoleophilia bacterium]|nr:GAF domain-containing protein [Thermoleophilia bacterium]
MSSVVRTESVPRRREAKLDATYAYLERHANRILAAGALVTVNLAALEVLRSTMVEDTRIYSVLALGLALTMFLMLHRMVVRMVRFALRTARHQSGVANQLMEAVELFAGEAAGVRGTVDALCLAVRASGCEVYIWEPTDRSLWSPTRGTHTTLNSAQVRHMKDTMSTRSSVTMPMASSHSALPLAITTINGSSSLIAAPMWVGPDLAGIVLRRYSSPREVSRSQDATLVSGFAALGAVALGKATVVDSEKQRVRDNELLVRSMQLAGDTASRDHLVTFAVQAAETLDSPRSVILATTGGQLRLVAAHGIHRSVALVARRIPMRTSFVRSLRTATTGPIGVTFADSEQPVVDMLEHLGFSGRVIAQPIHDATGLIGVVIVDSDDSQLNERETSLLSVLSKQVSLTLERIRMSHSITKRSRHLACTPKLARNLAGERDLAEVARITARELHEGFGYGRVSIALRDDNGELRISASSGMLAQSSIAVTCTNTMRAALDAARPYVSCAGETRIGRIDDPNAPAGCRSQLVVPIIGADHQAIGVIAVYERDPESLGEDDLHMLETIADQLTGTIEQAQLIETLERSYFKTVEALSVALEAKDAYTLDHARSITELSAEVGRRMGMDDNEIRDLKLGALLHDIGKIGVPEEILGKQGPLTDDEFEIMKEHTIIGEQIIAPIEFLEGVRPLVLHEHERWDGRGYPHQLAGEDIPLGARIIFVCDAWHAMVSDRPYRASLGNDVAMAELKECAGTQFDPRVVDVFTEVIESGAAALI